MKTFCLIFGVCLCFGLQAQVRPGQTPASVPPALPAPAAAPEQPPHHPAVELARTLLGIPYRWAGTDPTLGFDCSGLVYYVFNELQVRMPRMPRDLFKSTEQVVKADLKPGDLLFFNTFAKLSHVGIYIGEGRFIHAPRRGTTVTIESMDSSYYRGRYAGARRVMPPAATPAPPQAPGP
ncbi:MAG: C40 family peptidase [Betaproteobacteria bacterium]